MANVKIKHISLSNFCNLSNLNADLSEKTVIKGYNREGKSTIRNAILWVLTDKLSDGSAAGDNIRPHDENGKRIDGIDIQVSLTVDVDGSEYILTKYQKQKWVKKRGCEEREFQGNENIYEISGIPKRAKDYEQFIDENICPIDDLSFCINANTFLTLDAKKRRAKVLSLGKEFTNDEIIDKYPEFEVLRSELKVGTIEEITSKYKKSITSLKKIQGEQPTRIDEVSKTIVEEDFSALEAQRNDIHNKLQAIEAANAKAIELRKEINKAKIDLVTIKEKLSGSARDLKHNIELSIYGHKQNIADAQYMLEVAKEQVESLRAQITDKEMKVQLKKREMAATQDLQFATDSFICPTCGQMFPIEKQDEKQAEFEREKAEKITAIKDAIELFEQSVKDLKAKMPVVEKEVTDAENHIVKLRAETAAEEMKLSKINLDIDFEANEEYATVEKKIADLESELSGIASSIGDRDKLMAQLAIIDRPLAQKDVNAKAKDRIAELQAELRETSQKILDQEHLLHLLEQFNIKRIELLTDSVNQYFDIIHWVFWKQLINSGYQDVCIAEVNGTDYDTMLNKSDRILCQMDLCKGFQKAAGVNLPILGDDMESVDSNRIPNYENQMLIFRRDDCKLTIEKED